MAGNPSIESALTCMRGLGVYLMDADQSFREIHEHSIRLATPFVQWSQQVGNEVGSLACLVAVMADSAPVAASIDTSAENGALPQRGELTT